MKRLYSLLFLLLGLAGCNKVHKMGVKPIVESVHASTSYAQSLDLSYLSQVQTAVKRQTDVYPVCLTSYEGHKVTFRLIDGKWIATVRENLPDGFINQVQLPVCIDSGITMQRLLDATPNFQERHIHVTFPKSSKNKKGLVYIGDVGLKGGGSVSSRLYKFEGFTLLSDHISWPNLSNCNIGEAIAEVAKACQFGASHLRMNDRSRGPFRSGYAKCNLFVAEVLANIGLYTAAHGESGWRRLTLRIPTASDWANDRVPRFDLTLDPTPGCIVAEKYPYSDATGHVGIVVGYEQTVGTNGYDGGKLCKNDFGFRTDELSRQQVESDAQGKIIGVHLGNKANAVYLKHRDANSGLHTIIADDILESLHW